MQRLRKEALIFHPRRHTLRVQLTLLYSGLVIALCAAVLAAAGLLVRTGSTAKGSDISTSHNALSLAGHHFEVGPALIFAVAVALALVLGWWIAGRLLGPLSKITATAQDISANNLHQRLDLDGADDEFKQLGKTLDDLFGRLEAAFESQRHFVANASHELRTPLAGQRTLLQVALADPDADAESLRATCEEALRLGDQQERLVEALLTLASSERGIEEWERFDLGEAAEVVLLGRRKEAERRGIHIEATLDQSPAVGDPRLVESLVANLLDNALRHNVVAGQVEISTTSTGGRASISVGNTGPVIAPEEVERLFQPFQQVGEERVLHADGHGLGLAIVHAIARAHGADLTARPRSEGGLDVQVTFARPQDLPRRAE